MTTAAQHQKNRTRKDIIIRRLVTFFGCSVLVMLLVMIWHLVSQTLPLFMSPGLSHQQSIHFEFSELVSAGDVLDGEPLVVQADNCGLAFINVVKQNLVERRYMQPCTHQLDITEDSDKRWLTDISPTGLVRAQGIDNQVIPWSSQQNFPTISFALPSAIWAERDDYEVALAPPLFAVTLSSGDAHRVYWHDSDDINARDVTLVPEQYDVVALPSLKRIVAYEDNQFALLNPQGERLSAYTTTLPINWISSIERNRSLYIATGSHYLSRWVIFNRDGEFIFEPTYTLELPNNESPLSIQIHADSNAAILLTNRSRLVLFNRTTGEVLDSISLDSPPLDIGWFGSRVYLVFPNKLEVYSLDNPAGITTLQSLFEPVWYEGYSRPQHIYQTSSGADFHEGKFSLVPLFMGSIKAAFGALLIAIPLALGAAIYTGFLARERWRNRVKPVIEMLEAVPSVVIGFIAAILLVPLAEQLLIACAFFLLTTPLLAFAVAVAQQGLAAKGWVSSARVSEVVFAMLGVLVWGAISLMITDGLAEVNALASVSKTTLVLSVALGVAISPTIYTLAEDAIYSVPDSLKSASFALGATRLQTLKRIVLRVAMPGLIAAIMLGFGRAIGETMIVLMVTGNTPIAEWSFLESLRALTANIAIELPEAEVGKPLYTLLFFTASALFVFTFVFNTLAEGLRQRMRQQVSHV